VANIVGFEPKQRGAEMLEDRLLIWKLKRKNPDSLRRIYEKFKDGLLALAIVLSNDRHMAEDVVHDVIVSLSQRANNLRIRTSLKSYLATAVANRVRNLKRDRYHHPIGLNHAITVALTAPCPDPQTISAERIGQIGSALNDLPDEQREAIILHLYSGLKFKDIAESLDVSINTVMV
jgi:RNA polymerase sigma factor (sigma-70 family)